jgi:nitrite reductase/ring-hydroxylating ferredoxin subunit
MPTNRSDRPAPSTWDILASDRQPAPELLRPSAVTTLGPDSFATDVYLSPAKHREEIEKVWKRCWQMACREEQLAAPGAVIVYDLAELSAIVLRDQHGQLRAFANSCPHRGTRICAADGARQQLRCPFHGITWTLDGALKQLPCAWDFTGLASDQLNLHSLPIDTWGGFVFINFDADAAPLADYLEVLPEHFRRWPLEQRFTAAHVAKIIDCNWKVAIEAFIETFHVIGVHPQSLPFLGDANSQFDVWPGVRHVSRMINPSGVPSPHVAERCPPQRVLDAAAEFGLCEPGALQAGETPRQRIVAHLRQRMQTELGINLTGYSDSEVVDVIEYNLFPNLVVFGGFGSPLAYRVRPAGDEPGRCLFEVYLLLPEPASGAPPPPAPTRWLRDDETFGSVEALSYFGPILDQDADNMPLMQRGLAASMSGRVHPTRYQEIRVRHLRETLAAYLSN